MKEKGAVSKKQLMIVCAKSTAIAAALLALIYSALSYMGLPALKNWVY